MAYVGLTGTAALHSTC